MSDSNYSLLDRWLHRLALYAPVAEMSFDIDQKTTAPDTGAIKARRHVFVSGLARAGTTVLMRRFHATGLYRSLTYRDMPFVLAPNLWRRLFSKSKREIETTERAHGDDVLVDADSPESLDEVFWRVFAGDEYICDDHLRPHTPDPEVIDNYVRYVAGILAAQDAPAKERYLCKNNNNILRLGAIRQAFPEALILIPFRDPVQHANSLLRQHRRFAELHEQDRFALSYMTWLSHHEFGRDHRPMRFGHGTGNPHAIDTLDYWVHAWCEAYDWLQAHKPGEALFVCYEDLCTRASTWPRLAELADISEHDETGSDAFRLSSRPVDVEVDPALAARATAIYSRLVERARAQTG